MSIYSNKVKLYVLEIIGIEDEQEEEELLDTLVGSSYLHIYKQLRDARRI